MICAVLALQKIVKTFVYHSVNDALCTVDKLIGNQLILEKVIGEWFEWLSGSGPWKSTDGWNAPSQT